MSDTYTVNISSQEIVYNVDVQESPQNFDVVVNQGINDDTQVSTLVRAQSASWNSGGGDIPATTLVRSNSANWDSAYVTSQNLVTFADTVANKASVQTVRINNYYTTQGYQDLYLTSIANIFPSWGIDPGDVDTAYPVWQSATDDTTKAIIYRNYENQVILLSPYLNSANPIVGSGSGFPWEMIFSSAENVTVDLPGIISNRFISTQATDVPISVVGDPNQSGPLMTWQDSDLNVLASITPTGAIVVPSISALDYIGLPVVTEDDVAVSTKVRASSANWDSAYLLSLDNEQAIGDLDAYAVGINNDVTVLKGLSSNWNSVYSTVQANSATWAIDNSDDVLASTKVRSSSANWDSTYNTVQANSATWLNTPDDVEASTKVRSSSANWDAVYTTVLSNSASWLIDNSDDVAVSTKVRSSSANWDSTYNTFTNVSANIVYTSGNQSIDGEKTFIQDAVFNDTANRMPNQLAATSDAVMTRGLTLKELMASHSYLYDVQGSGFNNSGSGTAALTDNNGFSLVSSTTVNSWQRAANTRVWTTNPGFTGGFNNTAVPIAFSSTGFLQMDALSGNEFRITVGDAGSGQPMLALSATKINGRGFGMSVTYNPVTAQREVKLFAHNGTTYTESSSGVLIEARTPSGWFQNMILTTDGAGTIKLFAAANSTGNLGGTRVDLTTPLITLTGGPTSGNYVGAYISTMTLNLNSTGLISYRCIGMRIHVGEIY